MTVPTRRVLVIAAVALVVFVLLGVLADVPWAG
jgi:hypothetical protein